MFKEWAIKAQICRVCPKLVATNQPEIELDLETGPPCMSFCFTLHKNTAEMRLTVILIVTGDRTESNTTWSAGLNSPPESPPIEASPITNSRSSAAVAGGNNNKAIVNLSAFGNSFTHLAVNPF